jgi:uncharacterized secreted protein with C-terminal beta-propeller domain
MRANPVLVRAAAVVTGALAVSACTGGGDGAALPAGRQRDEVRPRVVLASALRAFDDCDALLGYVHSQAATLAGPYGIAGDAGGPRVFAVEDRMMATAGSTAGGAASAAPVAAARDAAPGYSATNAQEAGVDEPDVVKTDGKLLVSVAGGRLHVVDVTGGAPRVVGALDLPPSWGEPQLLLAGTRALVLSPAGSSMMPVDARRVAGLRGPEVTTTQVHVVDLATPSSPRIVSTVDLQGQLVAARMVDGVARVVVRSQPVLRGFTVPADDSAESRAAAERNNRDVVASSSVDDWVPSYAVVDGVSGATVEGGRLASCGDVFRPGEPAGAATVSVTSIDPRDPVPRGTASVVGGGELVYASASNLYVTTSEWSQDGRAPATTRIHRFSIADPSAARYEGSGSVPGRLLNQFSMSESAGVLRVASTLDRPAPESAVTTLRVGDDGLTDLGSVGGLGHGEQIYAVRFIGDTGYVVTFRRTDPLYVVDLRDPAHPAVRGELKVPGYSAYLHPVGDGLLLGVGQDADPSTGRVSGAQVSLFDVSDPAAPARLSTAPLGGGWSEVESDHHAFLWWAATGLAAVPVQPDGIVGFSVSRASGVREIGRVTGHGWARRAVVVGDSLLTVSDVGVASSDLRSLAERAFAPWR